ncbi:hypothetical protein T07_2383 [Trichinella nelsoni]|uniref:Uncharacterized protein n=1 Tax=Trichinella nelsoni TaxID=6336 RepID=A0A0V0RCW7_9BILA|nr:hypothetical protein T07_2383 [Trichinella nelsoni]
MEIHMIAKQYKMFALYRQFMLLMMRDTKHLQVNVYAEHAITAVD